MSRIHFVYAGNPDTGSIQAPYIITHKLYYFLKSKMEVIYHDWASTGDIDLQPDDILLGHPNYNKDTIVQKAFDKPCKAKFLIHPFHTNRSADNLPFDHLAIRADKIFAICGPYWYDTVGETPFAHWKPKMVRVDLAVDPNTYPYLKHTFNPPGARRLLYIGSTTPNKNVGYLTQIMKSLSDVTLHWYGGDGEYPLARLPNVKTTGWVTLDGAIAREICHYCDIMVSVSDSDANPTTTLETNAWGLAVACTKESGYYNDPMFHELYLNDFNKTIEKLRWLLTVDNEYLMQRSIENRKTIETHYTWDRFCNTIWDEIKQFA